MKIQAIIFDFGGVLVNWDAHRLYRHFFPDPEATNSFLREIDFFAWNQRQDAGRPFREGVAELILKFPQYAEAIQAYDTRWEESVSETIPAAVDILHTLKQDGWPLYLLSNFSAEKFPIMRRKYDFIQLFDDLIISGEHKLTKPDPAFYRLALQRIHRSAAECLFIDDSLENIHAARELGFHTHHFNSPQALEADLKRMGITTGSIPPGR
ncbi:MAG: HAD family phosphatase [Anaerolineaceae bacterium]|nr:HAD family phosphatase [Anaerolineaceae bacterium]